MAPLLLGDVGGTGTRLTTAVDGSAAGSVAEYRNAEFASFAELLSAHCAHLRRQSVALPRQCLLAIAGPVRDNRVHMTNRGWHIDSRELAAACDLDEVQIVNDFAALAWATLTFAGDDVAWLGAAEPQSHGSKVVLGPGTGLGVAALVPGSVGWAAAVGEGGHVTLAASTAEEAQVIEGLRGRYGHCSAERILSGPGIAALAEGLGYGEQSPETVGQWITTGDARGAHTVRVFAELLATVASDLALTFDARGGVYLGGGILPKLGLAFPVAAFNARFVAKGRYAEYLSTVPVARIVRPHPAFAGLLRWRQG